MFQRSLVKLLSLFCFLMPLTVLAQGSAFNLENWPETPANLKPMYVKAIMEQAGVHKVSFKLPADFYIAELDKFARIAAENNYRPYLKTSVAQNLATLAVVYCDWNNGVPPWEFAQKYLGDKQVELFKTLYPGAISKLQNNCAE